MGEAVCGSGEATGRAMATDCVCERWRCPPRGTLRLFWPLTPEFLAGPGGLRLTNDQGRTGVAGPRLVWSSARWAVRIFMQRRRAGERPLVTPYARRAESPCPACHVYGVSAETLCDCFHKPLPRKRPRAACSSLTGLSLPFREVEEAFREVRPIAPTGR